MHVFDELSHIRKLFRVDFKIVDTFRPLRVDVDVSNGNITYISSYKYGLGSLILIGTFFLDFDRSR